MTKPDKPSATIRPRLYIWRPQSPVYRVFGSDTAGIACDTPGPTPSFSTSSPSRTLKRVSIENYLAACQLMNVACNTSDTPSNERTKTLLAIDSELSTFAAEETNLRQARDVLVDTRNRSKMVAPVYKLPSEILASIFSDAACHCTHYLIVHELVPPILNPVSICGVCREWRRIALNHLHLWTHIDLVVSREDSGREYPSPEIWTRLSHGSSLHVNIRHYRSLNKGGEEAGGDGRFTFYDHKHSPAPTVVKLGDFLLPLMPQLCSLTLVLCSQMEYLPELLLDSWSRCCTIGGAKTFSVQAKRELPFLNIGGFDLDPVIASRNKNFLQSLERLGFHNAMPQEWSHWSFGNLISLQLEAGDDVWSMTQTELASVLMSCPRLQQLNVNNLDIQYSNEFALNPVTLNELRLLDIDAYDVEQTIESVLAIINPGPSALCMTVYIPYHSNFPHPVLGAIQSFVGQHNVTTLHIDYYGDEPYFASQFGPLPRVKTLVLRNCCFSDTAERSNSGITCTNPSSVGSRPNLWPNLQNLYLHECALEENHLRRLLLPHSIQSLYIRRCYKGRAFRAELLMEAQESEEFARSLSAVVPKTVHFKDGWTKWPILSRWESCKHPMCFVRGANLLFGCLEWLYRIYHSPNLQVVAFRPESFEGNGFSSNRQQSKFCQISCPSFPYHGSPRATIPMNVRVSKSVVSLGLLSLYYFDDIRTQMSKQASLGQGTGADRLPFRYLLLHARGITINRSWPPLAYGPQVLQAFRVIPILEEHVKTGLGSAEVNMGSIKSRRELTDTIPVMELTKQVLETWVEGLTSWELIGWVKEYNDRHQLAEGPEARVHVTIMVKAQTNKNGDFLFKSMKKKRDWSLALTLVALTIFSLIVFWFIAYSDL
ncbi:hypothetical protein FRC10_011411 [Ceratobasidium sp. 414]|nr:hypothetical protein FRC10_011411 [Ceratobasidium sp. 414]